MFLIKEMFDEMKRNDASSLRKTNRSLKNILESKHKLDNTRNCSVNKNFYDANKEVSEGTPKGEKKYGRAHQSTAKFSSSANNQQVRKRNDNNIECGGDEKIASCPHIPSESKNPKDAVNIRVDQENNE